jgi:nicotinamide riboside kinase
MDAASGAVIAIVGAESTGKTTLARELADAMAAQGRRVARVDEALREFCQQHGRTPRSTEQAAIAREQARRIAHAALDNELVIADTSALMVAIYSQHLFDDPSLIGDALADHAGYRLTLLTALDLPWVADGWIRDGAHVREPVDALLRAALQRGGVDHAVISGRGAERLRSAQRAVMAALQPPLAGRTRWRHVCAECGDADCERHLLRSAREAPPER